MLNSNFIKTLRLELAPFSEEFLTDKYVSWLNDPSVVRFSEQRFSKHNIDSCRAYLNSYKGTPNLFWAIVSKISEEGHIGNINSIIDERNSTADIGIIIGEKRVWRKGYGFEAFNSVVDFLFTEKRVRKVTAGTIVLNHAMLSLMDRMGMEDDGRRAKHLLFEGMEVDVVHKALFRSKWLK